jgi:YHS domain-containing protein
MYKDPVCGMEVNEEKAKYQVHLDHETFYFCSEKCKEFFEEDAGIKTSKKGFLRKFLDRLANQNRNTYGDTKPKCH